MRLSTELRYPRLFCTHLNFHVIILIRVEAVALPANLLSHFHFPNCGKVIDTKSKKPCGNPSVFMTQLWIDQDPPVNNKEVGFRQQKKRRISASLGAICFCCQPVTLPFIVSPSSLTEASVAVSPVGLRSLSAHAFVG